MYDTPKKRFTYVSISLLLYQLVTFLVAMMVVSTVSAQIYRLAHLHYLTDAVYISMLISMLITFLIVHFGFRRQIGLRLHLQSEDKPRFKEIAAGFLLGFGMNIALTLLFSLLSEAFSIPITGDGYYLTSYPLTNVLMIVTVVIAAPLFEEYLFRGVILMTLQRYGNWFAIMVSSLLFALSHGTISQAACVFFLGFVIGYLTVRSGSLRLAILFHMLNNAIALLPMFISSEMLSNLLSLVLLAAGIVGVVLLILLIRRRRTFVASLTTPYDYPISRFFQNWASILLIILFVAMLLINFVQIL